MSRLFSNSLTATKNALKHPGAALSTFSRHDPLSDHIHWISGVFKSLQRATKANLESPLMINDTVIGREVVFIGAIGTSVAAIGATAGAGAPIAVPLAVGAGIWKEIVKAHAPAIRIVFSPADSQTSEAILDMFFNLRDDPMQKISAQSLDDLVKSRKLKNVSVIFKLEDDVITEQGTVVDSKAEGLRFYTISWGKGTSEALVSDIGTMDTLKWPQVPAGVKGLVDWKCVVLALPNTVSPESSRRSRYSQSSRNEDSSMGSGHSMASVRKDGV